MVIWSAGMVTLRRLGEETTALREQVLNPPQQNTLPPDEVAFHQEIAAIAEQVRRALNPQAYAISLLSQSAQQHGLSVMSVESSEVMDAPPVEGGWKPRNLRFQLQGNTAQTTTWLTQLERVPLIVKLCGIQIRADTTTKGALQVVVEMEVLLPDPNAARRGESA
ncbi:MAG: hypothetical protein C4336_08630 [Armatimonadota bacterium]